MAVRKAGEKFALAGVGAALGAGGLALAQYLAEQAIPAHGREMTQLDHAKNNLRGFLAEHKKVTPVEMALYEGIRQGMMAGEISSEQVFALAASGKLPARVVTLLTDVTDFGQYGALPERYQNVNAPEQLGAV